MSPGERIFDFLIIKLSLSNVTLAILGSVESCAREVRQYSDIRVVFEAILLSY